MSSEIDRNEYLHPLGFEFGNGEPVEFQAEPGADWEPATFVAFLPPGMTAHRDGQAKLRMPEGYHLTMPLKDIRPVHQDYPPLIETMIKTAQFLTEPGEPNLEYIRGQAELICDLAGLDTDEHKHGVMSQIMLSHPDTRRH